MFIELHALQTFGPSNLNRDDTGNPKEALFGGVRRARISSQSAKRAMRKSEIFQKTVQRSSSERTKFLVSEIAKRLEAKDIEHDKAWDYAEDFVNKGFSALSTDGMKSTKIFEELVSNGFDEAKVEHLAKLFQSILKPKGKDKGKKTKSSKMREILRILKDEGIRHSVAQELAEKITNMQTKVLIYIHADLFDELAEYIKSEYEEEEFPSKQKIRKELTKRFEGRPLAPDIALFGRMLAEHPALGVEAACQVAHALSTHEVNSAEFDYFTAVDDLNPEEETGAGMLGLVAYNSATYYRCIRIDLEQLAENLNHDISLVLNTVEAMMKAFALVVPSGKKNSFVNKHTPDFLMAVVRQNNDGQSLDNAFEKPIPVERGSGYAERSVKALAEYWEQVDRAFRLSKPVVSVMNPRDYKMPSEELQNAKQGNLQDWIGVVVDELRGA